MTLKLKLKGKKSKRKKTTKRIKRALRKKGRRVTVELAVRVTDDAGNQATEQPTAALKLKR